MKILKFLIKLSLTLILFVLLFCVAILGILQTKQGQNWIFDQSIRYIEKQTDTQIQIGKLTYTFPLNLQLNDLLVSQDNQPLLSIQSLELGGTLLPFLQGKMIFSKFQARDVHVYSLREGAPHSLSENTLWDTLPIPFYLKLSHVDIQRIQLDQHLIARWDLPEDVRHPLQAAIFNVQGMMSHHPLRKALTAHFLLTLQSQHLLLPACQFRVDMQNHQLSLSFHCHSFPLHRLASTLPFPLQGHLALYASAPTQNWQDLLGGVSEEKALVEGHLKLSFHTPSEGANLFSTLIGEKTTIRSRYALKSKNAIDLLDCKLDNSVLTLQGMATLTTQGEIQNGTFHGSFAHLEHFQDWLGKDLEGQLIFKGQASGWIDAPSLLLKLESPRLSFSQQAFANISSTLRATPQDSSWKGFLSLTFDYQDHPWEFETAFDWQASKSFHLYQLKAQALSSHLTGDLSCHLPAYLWEGSLEFQSEDLYPLFKFGSFPLHGKGELKVHLTESLHSQQNIHAELTGQSLRWMDGQADHLVLHVQAEPQQEEGLFHLTSQLEGQGLINALYSVENVKIDAEQEINWIHPALIYCSAEWNARNMQGPEGKAAEGKGKFHIDDPLQAFNGTVQFTLANIQTATSELKRLTGVSTIHADQTEWPFHLNGQGVWKDAFLFDLEGVWHFQPHLLDVHVQQLRGHFGPYPLYLKQPLHFAKDANSMQLTGLHLQWGDAQVQADGQLDTQQVWARFKTNLIPSELFEFLAPGLPISGLASLEGQLEGSVKEPQGKLDIQLHEIQIKEDIFAQKPTINGNITLHVDAKGAGIKGELKGIGHTPLSISGTLPTTLNLDTLNFAINPHFPFDVALYAEGELDPYLHLFYNDVTNLSGHAKMALRLSGQMDAPRIQGHVDLVNGAYESLNTGVIFHNIQARLEGDGSKITLTRFSAEDKKQGSITATGALFLDASQAFPFDFQIRFSRLFVLDSDYAAISASGPLRLKGNVQHSKLQGNLVVDQATIRLEETLPRQIKTVEVNYINSAEGTARSLEKKEKNSTIELDIKLDASDRISIQGHNLKSEWTGMISISGTPDHPQLNGDLRITQGEYDFNGKVFNLSQGNIHFAGSPDKKTTLYVVASKDIERIRAEIIVKGLVTQPVISFRSNPPLSQREVLSYLLFNRGISDITTDQGDQLSQSFISLNSSEKTEANTDFLSRLRNNMGIDRLDFTTNDKENKEFGLQVGKNITENISVTVNQRMTSVAPVIAVEAKLMKNLKAQAEAGINEDAPVRMSIKWRKDY